jgi:hypothetical protein
MSYCSAFGLRMSLLWFHTYRGEESPCEVKMSGFILFNSLLFYAKRGFRIRLVGHSLGGEESPCEVKMSCFILFDSLLFYAKRGFRIRLVGHSLGGGVATLLGVLVRRDLVGDCIINRQSRAHTIVGCSIARQST